MKAIVHKGIQSGIVSSRTPILNVCITRWVENGSDSVQVTLSLFRCLKLSYMEHQIVISSLTMMAGQQMTKQMQWPI